jgi:hypothetical protein
MEKLQSGCPRVVTTMRALAGKVIRMVPTCTAWRWAGQLAACQPGRSRPTVDESRRQVELFRLSRHECGGRQRTHAGQNGTRFAVRTLSSGHGRSPGCNGAQQQPARRPTRLDRPAKSVCGAGVQLLRPVSPYLDRNRHASEARHCQCPVPAVSSHGEQMLRSRRYAHQLSRLSRSAYRGKCQTGRLRCQVPGVPPRRKRKGKPCPVAKSRCASCHMPKIDLPGAHYRFSDHRIRIVKPNEPYPG